MGISDYPLSKPAIIASSFVGISIACLELIIPLGKSSVFLLFVLIICLNTWYFGLKVGILTLFYTVLNSGYFLLIYYRSFFPNAYISSYEINILIFVSIALSYMIDKYKKTDEVGKYKRKLSDYKKDLEKATSDNQKMREEIKLRDEFLSIASHELKTPLTSMLLKTQSALHNIRDVSLANFSVENLLKMLETAEKQTQRMARMINDLLNVSLITTGKMNLELEKTNLSDLVSGVLGEFSERLEKGGNFVEQEFEKEVICYVDKLRIEQVITNLLSNAIKYGKGKPILVKVSNSGNFAKVQVKDNGIGIDSREKAKIFELFERGAAQKYHRGLGVGLYIAHQIVDAHKGRLRVESKLGVGSNFIVELPSNKK